MVAVEAVRDPQMPAMHSLPAPVARFRDLALSGGWDFDAVVFQATAWMRQGRLRIPLEFRMWHRLGHDFVHDIRLGRGPLSVRFGLDGYVDGNGIMKVATSVQTGAALDQAALVLMWAEVVGFPAAWQDRSDIRWQAADEKTAILLVPGPEGTIPITVTFDPLTGCPASVAADRRKGPDRKVGWVVRSTDWTRFEESVLAPGRFTAQWADEAAPWIDMRVQSVLVGVQVDAALGKARTLLHASRFPAGHAQGSFRRE